jgi:hypothetical protein
MILAVSSTSTSAWDQPGTLGFLVVFGMGTILYFVFRSLTKHLRKINEAARIEALQAQGSPGAAGEPAEAAFTDGLITGMPGTKDDASRA